MIWNPKQVEKVLAARRLGETSVDIATRLGITDKAVRGIWRRHGGPAPAAPKDEVAALRLRTRVAELEATKARLVAELADREDQLGTLRALGAAAPAAIAAPKRRVGDARIGVPVMLCSDWHVEERVDPKTVNGLNEYNLEIADRCITRMAEAFEWLMRDARYTCREGVVWLGGDLFSGYIHDELVEGNFLSPTKACLWLQKRLERMLRTIAATTPLEKIHVVCNDGNHGRTTMKKRIATRTANSFEWLLYHTLAARLADDPRFVFQIADGQWAHLDVMGHTLSFTHGDSFSYGGGVGGISIPIRRGIAREFLGRRAATYCMGHFHQRNDFGDITINGSMIGYNAFAQSIHAAPEPRQQTWFMVDSVRGKCLSAPIWL